MDEVTAQAKAPEPETEPARGGPSALLTWGLLVFLVAYPLSFGLAVRVHRSCPEARPAIEAAYRPLTFLAERFPPLRRATEWYLKVVWRCP